MQWPHPRWHAQPYRLHGPKSYFNSRMVCSTHGGQVIAKSAVPYNANVQYINEPNKHVRQTRNGARELESPKMTTTARNPLCIMAKQGNSIRGLVTLSIFVQGSGSDVREIKIKAKDCGTTTFSIESARPQRSKHLDRRIHRGQAHGKHRVRESGDQGGTILTLTGKIKTEAVV